MKEGRCSAERYARGVQAGGRRPPPEGAVPVHADRGRRGCQVAEQTIEMETTAEEMVK